MNALAQSLLGVAKGYLGPAAQQFLSNELHAMGVNANTVTTEQVSVLVERVREHAARVMGPAKAQELADALSHCQPTTARPAGGGHRLATDAAGKLLSSGKLRQAEKAYLELVEKHGDAESYIGLARAQAALEDEASALNTLRGGAAKFARVNDRATAVSLLAEAVALAPADLSAHRRLAAALANQGDLPGAVEEYGRYVDACLASHDSRRALLELAYGRETLGELPGIVALVDRVSGVPGHPPASRVDGPRPAARPPARVQPAIPAPPAPAPSAPAPAAPAATTPLRKTLLAEAKPSPAVLTTRLVQPISPPTRAQDAPKAGPSVRTAPHASQTAVVLNGASTVTHAEHGDLEMPVDMLARAGIAKPKVQRPKIDIEQQLAELMLTGSGIEAATIAASRAALLTGAHDARATGAVLDAARRLLALGKLQSASDVLLDFIGHGFTDREAQRLLIEVDCALGRRDVAKEKCTLLSAAYRLDGKSDVAEDVERLAKIL